MRENYFYNILVSRGIYMFEQTSYNCRFEWGIKGARDAAKRGDIIIMVDVLTFASATVTALYYGAWIFPYPSYKYAAFFAKQINGEVALLRSETSVIDTPSLSPLTFGPYARNKRYVLCSLNGATISHMLSHGNNTLLVGSFLNARAVAEKAMSIRASNGANIAVIASGERWKDAIEEDNVLRPCIEDYLGAGAILSYLDGTKSPEAYVCQKAFEGTKDNIYDVIWDCGSSRKLRYKGFEDDVKFCIRLNIYNTVPVLVEEHFEDISKAHPSDAEKNSDC